MTESQNQRISLAAFATAGGLLALGALFPDTFAALIYVWVAVVLLIWGVRSSQTIGPKNSLYRGLFLFGVVFHLLAFYWLVDTLMLFGGFPWIVAALIFILFVLTGSVQFLFVAWLIPRLELSPLGRLRLALPLAWIVAEFLVPRMFPWTLAHTQLACRPYVMMARFVGVYPLSGLLLWLGELLVASGVSLRSKTAEGFQSAMRFGGSFVLLVVSAIVVGSLVASNVQQEMDAAPKLNVGLVQGNLDAKQKRDVRYFEANLERYRELSADMERSKADLIFWPETVVSSFTPEALTNLRGTKVDPAPNLALPLVYGTLAYREKPARADALKADRSNPDNYLKFNGAFAIDTSGNVVGRYYKRVLMPFGEYMPFASTFPSIKQISPQSGDFDFGDLLAPIEVPLGNGRKVSLGMLICYEDLVPSLSADAANSGAQLLVNLTNDAWYGRTAAPYQHHLLAAWRAVETGRYLLRVTNTGLTAAVSPLGVTEHELPIFSEQTVVAPVSLLTGQTTYSLIGDAVSWMLVLIVAFLVSAIGASEKIRDKIRSK